MRTDVNACDCTLGFMCTVRESALKVDFGRKIPCCTGELELCQRHVGLMMLYQLSYVPSSSTFYCYSTFLLIFNFFFIRMLHLDRYTVSGVSFVRRVNCSFFPLLPAVKILTK